MPLVACRRVSINLNSYEASFIKLKPIFKKICVAVFTKLIYVNRHNLARHIIIVAFFEFSPRESSKASHCKPFNHLFFI